MTAKHPYPRPHRNTPYVEMVEQEHIILGILSDGKPKHVQYFSAFMMTRSTTLLKYFKKLEQDGFISSEKKQGIEKGLGGKYNNKLRMYYTVTDEGLPLAKELHETYREYMPDYKDPDEELYL